MSGKKTLAEADYPRIAIWASTGCRKIDAARQLGLSADTFRRILDEDERAMTAWEEGRGAEHSALVGVLYKAAVDKGNIVAAMFLLKARHGYVEGAPVESGNRVNIVFQLPAPLSPEQYAQVVRANPKAIEAAAEAEPSRPLELARG